MGVERRRIRLIDIVSLVPGDITKGTIKCKSGRKIEFTDISHLNAQYQFDSVECFDIKPNSFGERELFVWLAHN